MNPDDLPHDDDLRVSVTIDMATAKLAFAAIQASLPYIADQSTNVLYGIAADRMHDAMTSASYTRQFAGGTADIRHTDALDWLRREMAA